MEGFGIKLFDTIPSMDQCRVMSDGITSDLNAFETRDNI